MDLHPLTRQERDMIYSRMLSMLRHDDAQSLKAAMEDMLLLLAGTFKQIERISEMPTAYLAPYESCRPAYRNHLTQLEQLAQERTHPQRRCWATLPGSMRHYMELEDDARRLEAMAETYSP